MKNALQPRETDPTRFTFSTSNNRAKIQQGLEQSDAKERECRKVHSCVSVQGLFAQIFPTVEKVQIRTGRFRRDLVAMRHPGSQWVLRPSFRLSVPAPMYFLQPASSPTRS